MKTKMKKVTVESIDFDADAVNIVPGLENFGMNVRDEESNYDFTKGQDQELYDSILAVGLLEAPYVFVTEDGRTVVLKGNRRARAIQHMLEKDESAAKEHGFDKGFNAVIVEEATEEELVLLICDHQFFKKLSALEQFYSISKFSMFQMSAEEIAKQLGYKKGFVQRMLDLLALSTGVSDEAQKLYVEGLNSLKGLAGFKMPSATHLRKAAQVVEAAEGDVDAELTKKVGKDENAVGLRELLSTHLAGTPPTVNPRSKKDITERFDVETDDVIRGVLGWVLQNDASDGWEAPPAVPDH